MEKVLLFIKHRIGFLWHIIEAINDFFFHFLFSKELERVVSSVLKENERELFNYRRLKREDVTSLTRLIDNQSSTDLEYFNPHSFDERSVIKQIKKKSFLMMGAFSDDEMVGYFFLRFFTNRKCFVGRLIDKEYRGRGIGVIMNKMMYGIAWKMKFRCLSTISKNNNAVIKAHSGNKHMIILKELKNDYLLIEFLPDKVASEKKSFISK